MHNLSGEIKVLVVDDSAFMRKVVSDILNSDSNIKVVATAKNGMDALEKFHTYKPDIITLDIEMPIMDGIMCLRELHKISNVKVIMISSHTKAGAKYTIEALENGALDFVAKPDNILDMTSDEIRIEILEKVKSIGHTHTVINKDKVTYIHYRDEEKQVQYSKPKMILAIGSSTGGPRALQTLLSKLPDDLDISGVIVQHMPAGFTKSLAERLDGVSRIRVKEAEDGDEVKAGWYYIAPGDYHMTFKSYRDEKLKIILTKDPPVGRLRPCVDVMMTSLSETGINKVISVVLTGMGSDGSEGIKKLKILNKSYVIAQDESSCVVYGMPRAAYETGMVDVVLPLDEIAEEIIRVVRGN